MYSLVLADVVEVCVRSGYCLCKDDVLMYPTLNVNFDWLYKQVQ